MPAVSLAKPSRRALLTPYRLASMSDGEWDGIWAQHRRCAVSEGLCPHGCAPLKVVGKWGYCHACGDFYWITAEGQVGIYRKYSCGSYRDGTPWER